MEKKTCVIGVIVAIGIGVVVIMYLAQLGPLIYLTYDASQSKLQCNCNSTHEALVDKIQSLSTKLNDLEVKISRLLLHSENTNDSLHYQIQEIHRDNHNMNTTLQTLTKTTNTMGLDMKEVRDTTDKLPVDMKNQEERIIRNVSKAIQGLESNFSVSLSNTTQYILDNNTKTANILEGSTLTLNYTVTNLVEQNITGKMDSLTRVYQEIIETIDYMNQTMYEKFEELGFEIELISENSTRVLLQNILTSQHTVSSHVAGTVYNQTQLLLNNTIYTNHTSVFSCDNTAALINSTITTWLVNNTHLVLNNSSAFVAMNESNYRWYQLVKNMTNNTNQKSADTCTWLIETFNSPWVIGGIVGFIVVIIGAIIILFAIVLYILYKYVLLSKSHIITCTCGSSSSGAAIAVDTGSAENIEKEITNKDIETEIELSTTKLNKAQ